MTDSRAHARRYYRDEFEPQARINWRRVVFVLVLVLMAAATHGAAIRIGIDLGRELERREAGARPKPVAAQRAPLRQWACSKNEFIEYRRVCAARALSTLTTKEK